MGIDVYLKWNGQTEEDAKAQYTGFSTESGDVGYLREAYHGRPYAIAYLITENWDDQPEDGFRIPAIELKKRLPATVLATIYRHHAVYGQGYDPSIIPLDSGEGIAAAAQRLATIFADMPKFQQRDFMPNEEQVRATEALIERRALPKYALAFVDFVELAAKKEAETGEPCLVYVSA